MHGTARPTSSEVMPTPALKPASVEQCHAVIDTLAQQIAVLHEQIALLQERLRLDSRNSSKPPSSDGPGRGGARAERRTTQRTRGAQKGHTGSFRALLDASAVDAVHDVQPAATCDCGGAVDVRGKPYRHQVFDLPPIVQPEIQEYRLYSGICAHCGRSHRALLPAGVPSGQIGPRALALIGVLGTQYHLTQFKIRDLLARVMGVDFSVGAISQAHGKVAAALKAPVTEAAATLSQASVLHLDETGYPREGTVSGNWVWAAVQPTMAVFSVLPSRARYVLNDLNGESSRREGVIVSDRYSAYAYLDPECRQVCWAHLVRDFTRIAQRRGQAGRIGQRLLGLAYVMFRWREQARAAEGFAALQRRLQSALQRGASQTECSRTAKTCQNVLRIWPALWSFLRNSDVPPTNNAAEQALRSIVLKRKISGPTRSRRGEEFLAHGYTVFETCKRQGRDLLSFMHHAVVAWIDKTHAPSLVPEPAASG